MTSMSTLPPDSVERRTELPVNLLSSLLETLENDPAGALERLAADAVVTTPLHGSDDTRAELVELLAAFPTRRVEVLRCVGASDWACAEVRFDAVHRATVLGVPATQRLVRLQQLWRIRTEGGDIRSIDVMWCSSRLLSQLGRSIEGGVHR